MFKNSKCTIYIYIDGNLKENDSTNITDKAAHNKWIGIKNNLKASLKTLEVKPTYYLNVAALTVDKEELNALYELVWKNNLRLIYIYGTLKGENE